jgi:hypothetical protein
MVRISRKLKKTFFVFTFVTIACLPAISQSSFQPGYCITWENDTLRGLINNKGETGNFRSCTFKKDEFAEATRFSAEEIQAYRLIDDKYYLSKKIKTQKGEEQVFVEFLVDGISNLYFFRDPDNYLYLIEDEDGNLQELFNETETIYVEGKGEITRNTYRHIRMLKLAFSDCMEIQPQVENAELTHKSLIKLTKNYHDYVCDDQECVVYEKSVPPMKFQFAPMVGFTTSKLDFDQGFYSGFAYDQDLNFAVGVQINIVLPRVNDGFSVQMDLVYSGNNFVGLYKDYYELLIDSKLIQSSFAVKYTFPSGKIRPSAGIGVVANFLLNTDIRAYVSNIPGSPPQEQDIESEVHMSSNLSGGVLQLGCNYRILKNRELFSNFRYMMTSGESNGGIHKVKP